MKQTNKKANSCEDTNNKSGDESHHRAYGSDEQFAIMMSEYRRNLK